MQERKKYFISTLHAPFKNIWGFREINLQCTSKIVPKQIQTKQATGI
jgi:hypothetical protein